MKKIFVEKVGSKMVWFGAMPQYLDVQIANLKAQGFEIVKIAD
jgi:hypothetical protein